MAVYVKNFSDEQIKRIARLYLGKYETLDSVGDALGTTSRMISKVLFRGVAENILSESVSEQVFSKVVYFQDLGVHQRLKRWEKAWDERSDNKAKEKKRQSIENQITHYKEILLSYDDYFFDEEGAPTKEELISKLDSLNRELGKI